VDERYEKEDEHGGREKLLGGRAIQERGPTVVRQRGSKKARKKTKRKSILATLTTMNSYTNCIVPTRHWI
jgi:hypothetical protein